ncbi:hypothetical protein ABFW14_23225 [Mycolicibacterium fortuitum]|uniref:hypothetical protein n=1 Tax=Mycolicibacterium fortuitum TaxID=1766 RepID=UPI0034CD1785
MVNIWKTVAVATVGAGLTAGALALAGPAAAAPGGAGSAQQTIKQLEDEGYRVILSPGASDSISYCNVKAGRTGRDVTERKATPRSPPAGPDHRPTIHVHAAGRQSPQTPPPTQRTTNDPRLR